MKKILIINTVSFKRNGMSTVIMNYYTNMNHKCYKVDFVVNQYIEKKYIEMIEENGSEIYILERNTSVIKYFFDLLKIIKFRRYDIVHVHGNRCTMAVELLAAMMGGCKVRIAHSHNSTCTHQMTHKMLRPIFEICCTERIACSELAGKWLFRNKSFIILENAIDFSEFQYSKVMRDTYRKELGVRQDSYIIGHVGLFNEQKNQAFIIDILERLVKEEKVDCYVLFVGAGKLQESILRKAEKRGLKNKVIFYGESDDVSGLMSAMDVFLFPSKWEGLGIVMIEAQLTGLPCLASSNVPKATQITRNCIYLDLDVGAEKFCKTIKDLSCMKFDRSCIEISCEGKEKFDINKQANKLQKIYEQKV